MKTKEEFFQFERKQRQFFDDYYKQKGWPLKRIYGKENIKYDCLIKIKNEWIKIQEKVASFDYDGCLVELMQDIETNNKGWLYTCQADYILFKMPDNLYWINTNKLKTHMRKFGENYDTFISNKGWGKTLFAIIPWEIISNNKIGNKIIDKE